MFCVGTIQRNTSGQVVAKHEMQSRVSMRIYRVFLYRLKLSKALSSPSGLVLRAQEDACCTNKVSHIYVWMQISWRLNWCSFFGTIFVSHTEIDSHPEALPSLISYHGAELATSDRGIITLNERLLVFSLTSLVSPKVTPYQKFLHKNLSRTQAGNLIPCLMSSHQSSPLGGACSSDDLC